MFGYFDSSLFLAILLDEKQQEKALNIWKSHPIKISSVLLKIESNISLIKFYKQNKHRFGEDWLAGKKSLRKKLLNEVFFKEITTSFADEMEQNEDIAKCKSLDAIHIATAIEVQNSPQCENICICSFDNKMLSTAKELGFETVGN